MAVKAAGSVTVASITDVASTTRYYLLQASTLTAPAKPTANPPGGSWSATEPTYTEGSTNSLYTCDLTTFSDGTWAYSAVSLSTSYEAAKAAYNKAVAAANAAAATDQHFWADTDGAHVSSTGDHDLSGANLLLTATKLAFRNALSELFSIIVSGTSAVISFLGGKFEFAYKENSSGVDEATISSPSGILVTSESSNTAEYSHTLTTAEGAEGFLPAGTKLWGYANISPHDDLLGTHGDILLDCKQTDGTENMLHISLDTGCKLSGTQSEPRISIGASTKDGSAAAVSYNVSTTIRQLMTAIQPVVLYNGGAALSYDTTPGAGTTGTVTLSESAANFKEITVFFHYDVWACSSVTLTNPDGKTAGLYLMFVGADGNLWTKTRNVAIGGTSITNATNAANLAFSLTDGARIFAQSYDAPEITVDRVEGRR